MQVIDPQIEKIIKLKQQACSLGLEQKLVEFNAKHGVNYTSQLDDEGKTECIAFIQGLIQDELELREGSQTKLPFDGETYADKTLKLDE